MSKWYNEAVFYHIYPLGLTGAPKENRDGGVCHRMEELFPWVEHIRELGGQRFTSAPCLSLPATAMIQRITGL